jgi:hypothetical protein
MFVQLGFTINKWVDLYKRVLLWIVIELQRSFPMTHKDLIVREAWMVF